jgi:AcrR family transcriptional regulator
MRAAEERRTMPRQDRRRQIMRAAEKLFSSRRFHEITTDEVARVAGVGKGTMYRYFKDKDDLFFQTAMAGFDELCELLHEHVAHAAPFPEQLLSACREVVEFFDSRWQLFRMMQAEEFRLAVTRGAVYERWMEHRKKLIVVLADILRRGVSDGQIRGDVPPEVLGNFLMGMMRTRARDLEDAPTAVRRLELVIDLFCRGAGEGGPVVDGLPRRNGRRAAAPRRTVGKRGA